MMNFTVDSVATQEIEKLKARFAEKNVVKNYISFKKKGSRYVLGFENGQFLLMKIERKKSHIVPLSNVMAYAYLSELNRDIKKIIYIRPIYKDKKGSLRTVDPIAATQFGGVR